MVQFLVIPPILIEFLLILVHLFLLFFNIFLLLLHLFPYHSCSFSLPHPLPLPFTSLPPPLIKPLLPSSLLSPTFFICTVCHLLFSLSPGLSSFLPFPLLVPPHSCLIFCPPSPPPPHPDPRAVRGTVLCNCIVRFGKALDFLVKGSFETRDRSISTQCHCDSASRGSGFPALWHPINGVGVGETIPQCCPKWRFKLRFGQKL